MRILVVDDEKNIRRTATLALESMDHEADAASCSATALAQLKASTYDAIFLDLRLSQENGLDVLEEFLKVAPHTAVVIVTAYASIETAVEAMRRGAFDYLPKPFTPDQLRVILQRLEKTRKLERRVAELESMLQVDELEPMLTSHAPVMQRTLGVAFKAAESDSTVLLLGESGTGKSVLARAMHRRSPRREKPFVTVSCPSLSRELLESELFGHLKGSFTGAHADTVGKVTAAEGGTLFLDEIGDLPSEIQAKLLRLLHEREYERVGETKPRRANVRVISATNRDLAEAVRAGKFREDLFYRLNVISLRLPALRERAEDIETIATACLRFLAARSARTISGFSPAALEAMTRYSWPGNLRELRNRVERALIFAEGDSIDSTDLSEIIETESEVRLGGKFTLEEIEAEHIRRVISSSQTLEDAAKRLGIDPATLYRKRKRL